MNHILNGDSLVTSFHASGINGDAYVWREGFAVGPVTEKIEDKAFLTKRQNFWNSFTSPESHDFPDYFEFFVPQLTGICDLEPSIPLTIWFEHDLFCQVNMLALLSLLQRLQFEHISIVSIDQHPQHPNFKGLGYLNPSELAALLPSAQKLSATDIAFASKLWQLFCLPSPLALQESQCLTYPASFPFMHAAMKMHLDLFPSAFNGLNAIQVNILNKMTKEISHDQLLRELLHEDYLYGYGDVIFQEFIFKLAKYYDAEDRMVLNEKGKELLHGTIDFFDDFSGTYDLGGVSISSPPAFRSEEGRVTLI